MTTQKCSERISTEWGDRKESISALTDKEIREYPLCFDYVEANYFANDKGEHTHEAYHRYQMSYGGPQDEIRFYVVSDVEFSHKVTYAFLDWYDSAEIDITNEAITERFKKIYQV
jgi:hypothetical protein